jgi:hypothetical protein
MGMLLLAPTPAAAQDIDWTVLPSSLSDIGVGANGVVWGVNSDRNILRFSGSNWEQMGVPAVGVANRVAVGPVGQGRVWFVNNAREISLRNGGLIAFD